MGFKRQTAEGGTDQLGGTGAVSPGNSGGLNGDALTTVSAGAGGSINYSTVQKMHGNLSIAMTPASGVTNFLQFNDASSGLFFSTMFYVYLTGYPSATTIFEAVQTTAGGTVARLNVTTTGALQIANSAGTVVSTFTNVMGLNAWYRVPFFGPVAASTTITAKLYAGDSGTPIETQAPTAVNTGTTAAGRVIYGKFTATGTMAVHYFDDMYQDMQSSAEFGPAAAPRPIPTLRLAVPRAATF